MSPSPTKLRLGVNQMAVHAIEETAQMTDPAKGFMFELIFENLFGDEGITGEQIELRAQSYTLPGETVTETAMTLAGYNRNDSGLVVRGGDWSTTIIETQNYDALKRFESWINIMHDYSSGVTGLSSEYKTDVQVNALNAKKQAILKRKLKRAWPKTIGPLTYGPNNSAALQVQITWRFDWWVTV